MEDFNVANSGMDWAVSKICERLFTIASSYLSLHNSKAESNNIIDNLRAIGIYGHAEIPRLSMDVNEKQLYTALDRRLTFAENWSRTVKFTDLKKQKQIFKIFVDLNLYTTVKKVHLGKSYETTIPITKVINELKGHVVLLGGPGAGKTTISKYLCLQLINKQHPWTNDYSYPLVVRFRDFYGDVSGESKVDNFYFKMLRYLGIEISFHFKRNRQYYDQETYKNYTGITDIFRKIVVESLDVLQTIIILEGLDEMPDIGTYSQILAEIQQVILELKHSKIFLTSRTGIFHTSIQNADTYEIAPLSDEQIKLFIKQWIDDVVKAESLINQLNKSIYKSTSVRPINIAHLCAIFERYGEIPPSPKDVYRKIVNLLTEEWDVQRNIIRKSYYDKFSIDRKADFLKQIAYYLTTEFGGLVFTEDQLRLCYSKIHLGFGLPIDQMDKVLNEIESHTGLFVQSGYRQFEFSHKSIHEYLTADAIARNPIETLSASKLIQLPNELAICTALTFKPNSFFALLIIRELGSYLINYPFTSPYLKRLMDEKPEFSDSAILALAIIKLFEYNELRNNGKPFELQQEKELIFTFIDSHPNIELAFRNLSNYYFDSSKTTVEVNNKFNDLIDPNSEFKLIKKNGFVEMDYAKLESKIVVKWPIYKLIFNCTIN